MDNASNSRTALGDENISFGTLLASIGTGAAAFGVQFLLFNFFRLRLKRIYSPKTYLVPEKERIPDARPGIFGWVVSIFKTSNMEFIEKCGLDAYFFLRYLRMLLKIFVPAACVLLPILLPINSVNLKDKPHSGVNKFSVSNIGANDQSRKWVHLVAILCLDIYICYIMFGELRGYIRIRQAYLTSPQHRLRASATTVLVTNIGRRWLTREALDGLYDVFPGGVRNIWINRDYGELDSLVSARESIASDLENAHANLIEAGHVEFYRQSSKTSGVSPADMDVHEEPGMSTGNPHQIAKTLDEALGREGSGSFENVGKTLEAKKKNDLLSDVAGGFGAVGQGLGRGVGAVGHGVNRFGHYVREGVTDTFTRGKGNGLNEDATEAPIEKDLPNVEQGSTSGAARESSGSNDFAPIPAAQEQPAEEESYPKRGLFGNKSFKSQHQGVQSQVREGDEYPLHDLKLRTSGESTIDTKTKIPDAKPTQKKSGFLGTVVGFFVNSLEEEMPTKKELIELSKAETERRRRYTAELNPPCTKYVKESDRPTTHVHPSPLLNWIPKVGTKVDSIDYLTVALAVYNKHIERFQSDPERFPLMNSAFIQFNHQVAAHMACQSLNHHVPLQMTPRTVEISPDDVRWDSLSTPWWFSWIKTVLVQAAVVGLVILWAFPVAFTGALSNLDDVADTYSWLDFVNSWPKAAKSLIQGILPPALLGLLLVLLPLILRLLTAIQGMRTGNELELRVQLYYFVFLFVQVFLVATFATGISTILDLFSGDTTVTSIPNILAQQLPLAANYFFSYIVLQALSVSAGAILQGFNIFMMYLWSRWFDSSPRSLFNRSTKLPSIQWGTFFPVYTNFAVIGIVYSVIAPLILVFITITYALFWVVHRYNALYVNRYINDTGGLLFPRAVIQLFTGLYTMHLCWFGLFLLAQDAQGNQVCIPQAIIVVILAVLLLLYQLALNKHFSPLYRYIPITMEDDAVERDEEFAALQARRHDGEELSPDERRKLEGENLQWVLEHRERREEAENKALEEAESKRIEALKQGHQLPGSPKLSSSDLNLSPKVIGTGRERKPSWTSRSSQRSSSNVYHTAHTDKTLAREDANEPDGAFSRVDKAIGESLGSAVDGAVMSTAKIARRVAHHRRGTDALAEEEADVEAQKPVEERYYHGMNDELEDLTSEERDILVNKAFRHRALRATRPAVWIPKDKAGISEFEIKLVASSEELSQYIWISNEGAGLKRNGKVNQQTLMRPPDFNEERLIKL
ncbi:DUF221-domain-containing protein [Pseudovirgaria hyperparasitica]|uniref:DUF221-domain-containing protein n=1 Tax=Pseudovirgaria hyperparasitica TaxID=470096 RepID=A0A6A6VRM1_9PEZI|nr:DUF221-domain-containing protein [Pseudovirgaria hyperparasitica]KAF2753252.1 DUF221-domain-containing protein [Pseudovirgaria hyperparasitica]